MFAHYSPKTNSINIPIVTIASEPSLNLALYMGGLILYCYILILPLIILGFNGLKDYLLKYWIILCLGIPLITMVLTTTPLYFWNRWVYLLVYPLLFFAVQGLDRLWNLFKNSKNRIKRVTPKIFAIVYVALFLTLSGYYLAANPENQISFFSKDNPYLTFIPSSMLQNTLPIDENRDLLRCFQWLDSNALNDSSVVMHYALYDLAHLYLQHRPLLQVRQGLMWDYIQNRTAIVNSLSDTADAQVNSGHSAVYTVWWVSGQGWYDIPSLPPNFLEVFRSGNMAVYIYNSAQ